MGVSTDSFVNPFDSLEKGNYGVFVTISILTLICSLKIASLKRNERLSQAMHGLGKGPDRFRIAKPIRWDERERANQTKVLIPREISFRA
jgi:hypothetical protein